ncbi:hypothetical protein [Methanimicrococcus hongohii]|uniref:hypothetical protein n=1 Tax=Methanimicrococcus hongohii TaxID=3028295 RepID=UPI00292D9BFB|nr:hypothetical protein [Methanimicrococcus sp. Hf6]
MFFGSGKVFSCNCLLLLSDPTETANLQLSFMIAAANQFCVTAAAAAAARELLHFSFIFQTCLAFLFF